LVLWIPLSVTITEGVDALLSSTSFFVTPGATEGSVKPVLVQSLQKPLSLHHISVHFAAVSERTNTLLNAFFIDVNPQVDIVLLRDGVAECDHLTKLPGRVDVEQWEGDLGRIERLARYVQHGARILSDTVEHDRIVELCSHLAHDVNAFCLELPQVGKLLRSNQLVRVAVL